MTLFADPDLENVLADGESFLDLTATKQLVSCAEEVFEIAAETS